MLIGKMVKTISWSPCTLHENHHNSILLSYSNHLQTSIVHNNPSSMDFREQSFTWTAPSDDGFVNFMYVITNLTCFFPLSNV